jgi:hypothetical protein
MSKSCLISGIDSSLLFLNSLVMTDLILSFEGLIIESDSELIMDLFESRRLAFDLGLINFGIFKTEPKGS